MPEETATPSLALMFVDVTGSTGLYEALGDARAHAKVDACLRQLGRISTEFDGRVIKTAGDGAFYSFSTADNALLAAGAMLELLARQRQVDDHPVAVHIGCHFGPVIESNGDLFGDAVNLASRVAGLAKSDQIILTDDTFARLSPAVASRTRQLNRVAVRGKREEIAIWEYLWQEVAELTALSTRAGSLRGAHLLLRQGTHETILGAGGPTRATFGRDATCDFVIEHQRTSRSHAIVELRFDKFVIVDHSSNGTWVRIGDESPMVLRREELILRGSGVLTFGRTPDDVEAARVEFVLL
jgi:class 3 adenylate cyclase